MLAAGGTIAMAAKGDGGAVPSSTPARWSRGARTRGGAEPRARTVDSRPSAQLTAAGALEIARAAAGETERPRGRRHPRNRHARGGRVAVRPPLRRRAADRLHRRDAPGLRAGRRRPGEPVRRGVVAGAAGAEGLGVLVAFAGAVHAARAVRKADSTGPDAFDSPGAGPIGRVQQRRAWMARRVERLPPLAVERLDAEVHVVGAALGAGGALVDAAVDAGADGLVAVALGAGHTSPAFVAALERAAARVPVVDRATGARRDPPRDLRLRGRGGRPAARARSAPARSPPPRRG